MSISRIQGAQNTGAANATATGIALLRKANPAFDRLVKENPGVGLLAQRLEANGLIVDPKPTDAKADIDVPVWTHSKKSGYMPVEPFKDIIVAFQYDANGKDLGIGGYGYAKGKVVGLYRLDQFAFSSEAEAKKYNPKLEVVEFEPGKFLHISDDKDYVGSYEWGKMKLTGYGPAGQDFEMRWAIIGLSPQGNAQGGGFGGYSGRQIDATFGESMTADMPDH